MMSEMPAGPIGPSLLTLATSSDMPPRNAGLKGKSVRTKVAVLLAPK